MIGDPFRRSEPQSVPGDPRYSTDSDPIDRANEKARERDVSFDQSTSPALELMNPTPGGRVQPASRSRDVAETEFDAPTRSAAEEQDLASLGRFGDYETIRRRLDQAGAANLRFDKDQATNETVFSCEVPHGPGSSTLRVFEAKSTDELKAMQAVAEQVEKWKASLPPS